VKKLESPGSNKYPNYKMECFFHGVKSCEQSFYDATGIVLKSNVGFLTMNNLLKTCFFLYLVLLFLLRFGNFEKRESIR